MNDYFWSGIGVYAGTLVLAVGVGLMGGTASRTSKFGLALSTIAVVCLYFVIGYDAPFVIPIFLVVTYGIDFARSLYSYRDSPLLESEPPLQRILISIAHPTRVREAALDRRRSKFN